MINSKHWEQFGQLAMSYSRAIGRLQVYGEVVRLGFEYVPVMPDIKRMQGGQESETDSYLLEYAKSQQPELFDLHQDVCFRLWGKLEAYIGDVIRFLLATGSAQLSDAKEKFPLNMLTRPRDSDWCDDVLRVLETATSAKKKSGVNRFEELLALVGASGQVDEKVKHLLFLCSKYRNCIAHSDGRIDRPLIEAVPAFEGSLGNRLGITSNETRRFIYSGAWYMLEVQRRILPDSFPRLTALVDEIAQLRQLIDRDSKDNRSLLTPREFPNDDEVHWPTSGGLSA
jgi:hypothetical protein